MSTAASQRLPPLSRERVLECAVALADESGLAALTIRTLAQSMGTKPMSLYYYVANKEEILDGIVDMVFSEIEPPVPGGRLARGNAAEGSRSAISAQAPPMGSRVAGKPIRTGTGHTPAP